MQIKKILLTGYLCISIISTYAQQVKTGSITGTIKDSHNAPIPAASVKILNSPFGSVSSENGYFKITNIPFGTYSLRVSAIGRLQSEQTVIIESVEKNHVEINMEVDSHEMESVSVFGRTETQIVNRQAYNVTAIDASKLHNSTLDLSHALDRVSGVRIRESGGVGSSFNFSLNGFSGNQVKFFMDGIPMDNFGSSFQINNIPINFAERIEIYKGVVPIWLGSDALGGAVNIITGNKQKNFFDISYSYGSFNTHRTGINAAFTAKTGFTFQLNAFQNYSNNNYPVTLDVADINTGAYYPNETVNRFHDTYHNETMVIETGVLDKSFADKLLFGITLGQNYKEIQTGARMTSVFGAWHRLGNMIMPTLKYQKKDFFTEGLDITLNANYNLGNEQNIDTAFRRYDWFGDYKEYSGPGSERSRSMYKYKNNNGIATGTLSYEMNAKHQFTINDVFSVFNREGKDELYPDEAKYEQPQKTNKNILGLGYKYDYSEKWSTSLFGKYLLQRSVYSSSYNPSGNWGDLAYQQQENTSHKVGYGLASTYFIKPQLQLKVSYEKSNRMPENEEMFGDQINKQSNLALKPEVSDNVNLGFSYSFPMNEDHRFNFSVNAIYRYATDFIYNRLNHNQTMLIADNLEGVSTVGGDGEIRYSYRNFFTIGTNLTYQDIRNQREFEPGYSGTSAVYKDRMPNLPFLFGNTDASLFFEDLGNKGNNLSIGYNLLYVHAYYLYWPSRGASDGKYDIPTQLAHDANIVYTLQNGKYNIALECKNLFDAQLFDNFSLQKPSRGFYLKLRYFLPR